MKTAIELGAAYLSGLLSIPSLLLLLDRKVRKAKEAADAKKGGK